MKYAIRSVCSVLKLLYLRKEWRLWANEADDYLGACTENRMPFRPRPLPIGWWCSIGIPPPVTPEYRLLWQRVIWKLPFPPLLPRGPPSSSHTYNVGTRCLHTHWVLSLILNTVAQKFVNSIKYKHIRNRDWKFINNLFHCWHFFIVLRISHAWIYLMLSRRVLQSLQLV